MKRYVRNLTGLLLAICVVLTGLPTMETRAANEKVTVGNVTVEEGTGEVTVSVTASSSKGIAAVQGVITYDASVIQYVSGGSAAADGPGKLNLAWGATDYSNLSTSQVFSLKFKVLKVGSSAVTAQGFKIVDADEGVVDGLSGSGTVTIKQKEQAPSTNVNLSKLTVSPGTLSPAFSPDVTNYTLKVGADQERIVVEAPAADPGNTRVSISGVTKLQVGENTVTITVTAKDSSDFKKYTIIVTREAPKTTEEPSSEEETESESETAVPVTGVTIGGKEYYFVEDFSKVTLPEGYEEGTYTYQGTEVTVGKGLAQKLILFALTEGAEGSEPQLFVYDEAADAFFPYAAVTVTQKMYTILPVPADAVLPAGYEATVVTIDGKEVEGLTSVTEQEDGCYLLYAMNWDGQTGWYRYDSKEGTMQRAADILFELDAEKLAQLEQELADVKAKSSRKEKILLICGIGFSAAAVAELVILISMFMKKKHEKEDDENALIDTGELPQLDLEAAILAEAGLTELQEDENPATEASEEEPSPEEVPEEIPTEEAAEPETAAELAASETAVAEMAAAAVEEEDDTDIFTFFDEDDLIQEALGEEEAEAPAQIEEEEDDDFTFFDL